MTPMLMRAMPPLTVLCALVEKDFAGKDSDVSSRQAVRR